MADKYDQYNFTSYRLSSENSKNMILLQTDDAYYIIYNKRIC